MRQGRRRGGWRGPRGGRPWPPPLRGLGAEAAAPGAPGGPPRAGAEAQPEGGGHWKEGQGKTGPRQAGRGEGGAAGVSGAQGAAPLSVPPLHPQAEPSRVMEKLALVLWALLLGQGAVLARHDPAAAPQGPAGGTTRAGKGCAGRPGSRGDLGASGARLGLSALVRWAPRRAQSFQRGRGRPADVNLTCFRCFRVTSEARCRPAACAPADRVCVSHAVLFPLGESRERGRAQRLRDWHLAGSLGSLQGWGRRGCPGTFGQAAPLQLSPARILNLGCVFPLLLKGDLPNVTSPGPSAGLRLWGN